MENFLGQDRMTKEDHCIPEWKTLQTLTNEGKKRKLDTSPPSSEEMTKKNQCASSVVDSFKPLNQGRQKKEAGSSHPSSGSGSSPTSLVNGTCKRKLMMRVGPPSFSVWMDNFLGQEGLTKKINVHHVWKTLQTLQWGKWKRDHLLRLLVKWAAQKKTNMRVGPSFQSGMENFLGQKDEKKINVLPALLILQTLTKGLKKEDGFIISPSSKAMAKKINVHQSGCILQYTNQWGKKEAGSSPPSSGKWAAKRKLMMRVGPLILSLDGKLLGPRRMTNKINVHPEWKTLQTLTNGAKRKDGSSPPFTLVNWAAKKKTNDESGTPRFSLDGKKSWQEGLTKKINVHPPVVDTSNT
ncbi:hypothetical protein Tco_0260965 [Tanacetum coccineum]